MPSRFLNNININDEYSLPNADGSADQIITTDGAGQLSFVDQSTLNSGSAERTEILVKNVHGSALSKGDPVYIIGSVGASDRLEVALADASNAAKMPCVGLLTQDLANNGEGTATVTGKLRNLITSPIDGATPTENDTIYVKSGGGLTLTKPTGSTNLIQNVGQVGRVSTSADGNIVVSAILRSNDIPNLPTGKIWVGDGNTTVSDVVYLDEVNGRMGIGTTSPATKLHISDATTPEVRIQDTTNNRYLSLYQNNSNSYIQSSLNSALVFSTHGANERMRITTAGNVGVGTTSPVKNLNLEWSSSSVDPQAGEGLIGGTSGKGVLLRNSNTTVGTFANLDFRANNVDARIAVTYNATNNGDFHFILDNTTSTPLTRLFIQGQTGNVGIGTTSPTQKLQVEGNARVTGAYYDSNNSPGTSGQVLSSTATGTDWVSLSEISGVDGTGTTNYVAKWSDTDTITDSVIYDNGTNVGIGTTSPQEELHIASTVPVIRLEDTDGGYAQIVGSNGSLSLRSDQANTVASSIIDFTIDNSERMRIASDGNVGIGTTSPSSFYPGSNNLVVGSGTGDKAITVYAGNTSTAYYLFAKGTTGVDRYHGQVRYNFNADTMEFTAGGSTSSKFTIKSTGVLQVPSLGQGFLQTDSSGNISTSGGGTLPGGPYLPLAGGTMTGDLLMDGKAGVGNVIGLASGTLSDAMSLKLYTYNNIDPGGGLGTSTGNMIQADLGSNLVLRQTANDGDITFQSDDGAGGIATYLTLDGSSTHAYFSNPGNVGIGTTSPGDPLTVIGKISSLGGTNNAKNIKIYANDSFGYVVTNASKIYMSTGLQVDSGLIGSYNEDLQLQVSGGTKMYLDSSGNVGIGTTSPTDKLTVENGNIRLNTTNSSVSQGLFARSNNSSPPMGGISWNQNPGFIGSEWYHYKQTSPYTQARIRLIGDASSGGMFVNLNGSDVFTIKTSSGNVGIGTTSPQRKLDIENGGFSMFAAGGTSADAFSVVTHNYVFSDENEDAVYSYDGTDGHEFSTNGSPRIRITQSGNVGIGTTSPSEKLHVYNGKVYVTPISYASNQSAYALKIGAYNNTAFDMGLQAKSSSGGSPYMSFRTTTADDVLVVRGSSVGIGTSNPSQELDVDGDATFTGRIYTNTGGLANVGVLGKATANGWAARYDSNNANYSGFYFDNNNHNIIVGRVAGGTITNYIAASGSSYLNGGNVGIGVTAPSTKLEVVDTFSVQRTSTDSEGFYVTVSGTDANAIVETFYQEDSSSRYGIRKRYDGSTNLYQEFIHNNSTTGTEVYRVDRGTANTSIANGNVGIGTTSPSEKLEVNGHIKAVDGYKGYVSHFHSGGFDHFPRSGDGANPMWIPSNYIIDASTDQYYNVWVPLYAGRIRKIIIKNITGTPTATVCTFRKKINGVLSGTTYAGTVTGGGAAGMKVTFDFGTTNFTFNAEDEVQIGIVTGVATQPPMRGVSYQIWYEYNIT